MNDQPMPLMRAVVSGTTYTNTLFENVSKLYIYSELPEDIKSELVIYPNLLLVLPIIYAQHCTSYGWLMPVLNVILTDTNTSWKRVKEILDQDIPLYFIIEGHSRYILKGGTLSTSNKIDGRDFIDKEDKEKLVVSTNIQPKEGSFTMLRFQGYELGYEILSCHQLYK